MGILALKVLAVWYMVALATGLALGATIRKADRARKDKFLTDLFSTLEARAPSFAITRRNKS